MQKENFHLTYCTNIHPSNTWTDSFQNIKKNCLYLKKKLLAKSFGIGLRLANNETLTLSNPKTLREFKQFLDSNDCYVFTLNGFPYGDFHRTKVKEWVHAPDWLTVARIEYTKRLSNILAFLLPAHLSSGGISTNPLTYRHWVKKENAAEVYEKTALHLSLIVEHCLQIRQQTNKIIHLDLEPEPDGLLQTTAEVVEFFNQYLFDFAAKHLAEKLKISFTKAEGHIRQHLRVCFDICHAAVLYEDSIACLNEYQKNQIQIGKIQISSALEVNFNHNLESNLKKIKQLSEFADSTYLHQVCEYDQKQNKTKQFTDLAKLLAQFSLLATNPDNTSVYQNLSAKTWRIHFHVPVFVETYLNFASTQKEIKKTLAKIKENKICEHLEIETYTWEILPESLKGDLCTLIEKEYQWVLQHL